MPELGSWHFRSDRDATAAAYDHVAAGNSATCTCRHCRNFLLVRDAVFPVGFKELLASLGVDPAKDAEVYHEGRLGPDRHCYGGWYHFIGVLDVTGDFAPVQFGEGFITYLCDASAPRLEPFKDRAVVQLEFRAENVPWRLNEAEPQ
jgi:hypothetical protein